MILTEFNGNFGLDEIKKITLRNMGLNTVYDVRFTNDKRILIATRLHCFLTDGGHAKKLSDLKAGDKIWINTSELSKFEAHGKPLHLHDVDYNPDIKAALNASICAIYFSDSSDYRNYHYRVIRSLTGLDEINENNIAKLFNELNPE